MEKRHYTKLETAIRKIQDVIDELDAVENAEGYNEDSYNADRLSYAVNLLQTLIEEDKAKAK